MYDRYMDLLDGADGVDQFIQELGLVSVHGVPVL